MLSSFIWAIQGLKTIFAPVCSTESKLSPAELEAALSRGAEVYLPGSQGFANATARWSAAIRPDFAVVVKVKTEQDVQHTIRFANKLKRPFLAISGGHGQISTLNNVRGGIAIWMRGMNSVRIVDGGQAGIVGGGIQTGELLPQLWDQGKQTVTTGCDCAGFISPLMGGGHGWLQGRYGLLADNLISARMVLANGSSITVSDSEHTDLFWAIRGAGHNFGVYTEVKIKIYDRTPEQDQWNVMTFVFTQDKIGRVFGLANEWLRNPDRPVRLTHYGVVAFNPEVDPTSPVLMFLIYWQGSSIPKDYTDPLDALAPESVRSSVSGLAEVNAALGARYGMPACEKGHSRLQYPVSLDYWPIENLRTTLEIFASLPVPFRSSVLFLEAYAMNRVTEIPSDSIAYSDRAGNLLVSPILTYPADASLDDVAFGFGKSIRMALLNSTAKPLVAYVNYAHGDESLEAIYGYERWRLEKLKKVKAEYDPFGRFNFYAPIR